MRLTKSILVIAIMFLTISVMRGPAAYFSDYVDSGTELMMAFQSLGPASIELTAEGNPFGINMFIIAGANAQAAIAGGDIHSAEPVVAVHNATSFLGEVQLGGTGVYLILVNTTSTDLVFFDIVIKSAAPHMLFLTLGISLMIVCIGIVLVEYALSRHRG